MPVRAPAARRRPARGRARSGSGSGSSSSSSSGPRSSSDGSDAASDSRSDADVGAVWYTTADRVPRHLKLYHPPCGLVVRSREMLADLEAPNGHSSRPLPDAPAAKANFTFVCLGTGGGPIETDASCYLLKPGGRPPPARSQVHQPTMRSQAPLVPHPISGPAAATPTAVSARPALEHSCRTAGEQAAEASDDRGPSPDEDSTWGWEDGCIAIEGGTFLGGLERTLRQPERLAGGGNVQRPRRRRRRSREHAPEGPRLKEDGYPESDDEYSYGPAFVGVPDLSALHGLPLPQRGRRRVVPSRHQQLLWKVGQVGAYVRAFLVSHTHLDHTLGMALACAALPGTRNVYGLSGVLSTIRDCLFDGSAWPPLADWAPGTGPEGDTLNGFCATLYSLSPLTPSRRTPILEGWLEVEAFPVSHGRDPRLPPDGWDETVPSVAPSASEPRDSISSGRQSVSGPTGPPSRPSSADMSAVAPSAGPSRTTSRPASQVGSAAYAPPMTTLQPWSVPSLLRRAHSYAFDRPEQHAAVSAALRRGSSSATTLPYAHSYPYTNSLSFSFSGPSGPSGQRRNSQTPLLAGSPLPHGYAYAPGAHQYGYGYGYGAVPPPYGAYGTYYYSDPHKSLSALGYGVPYHAGGAPGAGRERRSAPDRLATAPSSPAVRPLRGAEPLPGVEELEGEEGPRLRPLRPQLLAGTAPGVPASYLAGLHHAHPSSPPRAAPSALPTTSGALVSPMARRVHSTREHPRVIFTEPYLNTSLPPSRNASPTLATTFTPLAHEEGAASPSLRSAESPSFRSERAAAESKGKLHEIASINEREEDEEEEELVEPVAPKAIPDPAETGTEDATGGKGAGAVAAEAQEERGQIDPHAGADTHKPVDDIDDRLESTAFVLHNPVQGGSVVFFGDVESDMLAGGGDAPACPPPPSLFRLPRPSVWHRSSHARSSLSDEDAEEAWTELAALASQRDGAGGKGEGEGEGEGAETSGAGTPPALPPELHPHMGWTGNQAVWARSAQLFLGGQLNAIFLECSFPAEHPLPTLYGHLSAAFWPVELVALARAVRAEYRSLETRWRAAKHLPPLPPPSEEADAELRSLRGTLKGLTLVVIHVKSALYPSYLSAEPGDGDGDADRVQEDEADETPLYPDPRSMQHRILTELRAWEKRARLGVRIELARQGQRIEC